MKIVISIFAFFCIDLHAKDTNVYVSIVPQAFMVKEIANNMVSVNHLINQNQTPETFTPTPLQIKKLSKADIYFKIDASFEDKILKNFNNAFTIKTVNTALNIKKRELEKDDHSHHNHNHHHHHDSLDPHIWLSPPLVSLQALEIYKGLASLDKDQEKEYKKNYLNFVKKLDEIDQQMATILKPYKGRTVFVFHPAFGYFLDRYGLKQKAIEVEGKWPKPKQVANLIKAAKKEKASVIFIQPQFDKKAAKAVALGINGEVLPLDPLAENLFKNWMDMALSIKAAFDKK